MSDLLLELEVSLHQKGFAYNSSGEWGIDFEEGKEIEYHKASIIKNVIDTGIVYEGMKYFEIDNGYGLKNLVGVYESSIPNEEYPLYELGYFENGIYYNPTYNIKVSADRLNEHESSATNIGIFGQVCFNETLHIGERNSAHFLEFYTYEFKDANTAQSYNVLESRPDYTLLDTAEMVAGKSYHRAESEEIFVNRNTTSVLLWRCEENRVYVIYSGNMISKNELLDLISPLSGE